MNQFSIFDGLSSLLLYKTFVHKTAQRRMLYTLAVNVGFI
jgi:hypothetical protein